MRSILLIFGVGITMFCVYSLLYSLSMEKYGLATLYFGLALVNVNSIREVLQ